MFLCDDAAILRRQSAWAARRRNAMKRFDLIVNTLPSAGDDQTLRRTTR